MLLISSLTVHHYNNIMCLPNLKFGLPSSQSPGHYSESCRNSWNTFSGFNVWSCEIIVNVFLPQQKMRKKHLLAFKSICVQAPQIFNILPLWEFLGQECGMKG